MKINATMTAQQAYQGTGPASAPSASPIDDTPEQGTSPAAVIELSAQAIQNAPEDASQERSDIRPHGNVHLHGDAGNGIKPHGNVWNSMH